VIRSIEEEEKTMAAKSEPKKVYILCREAQQAERIAERYRDEPNLMVQQISGHTQSRDRLQAAKRFREADHAVFVATYNSVQIPPIDLGVVDTIIMHDDDQVSTDSIAAAKAHARYRHAERLPAGYRWATKGETIAADWLLQHSDGTVGSRSGWMCPEGNREEPPTTCGGGVTTTPSDDAANPGIEPEQAQKLHDLARQMNDHGLTIDESGRHRTFTALMEETRRQQVEIKKLTGRLELEIAERNRSRQLAESRLVSIHNLAFAKMYDIVEQDLAKARAEVAALRGMDRLINGPELLVDEQYGEEFEK